MNGEVRPKGMVKYDPKESVMYYDQAAVSYDEDNYGGKESCSSPTSVRLQIVKSIMSQIPIGKIIDVGCGTGQLLCHLAENGYECAGCDVSEKMLKKARDNILDCCSKDVLLVRASLNNLRMFRDRFFDHVFCLGVFPYIPEEMEEDCYKEVYRIIKPNGYFVTAHENEIFDAFTFNRYTLRFFERNIYPVLRQASSRADLETLRNLLGTLIKNPDMPVNTDARKSARDIIFTKPENPITYPQKLSRFGFVSKEIYYYHFHSMPPLLMNESETLLEISKEMEIRYAKYWQGMFMASTFISVAQAVD